MKRTDGFTLVEVMIVMAIFAILILIATPAWLRARENSRSRACQENLQKIHGAIEEWGLENRQPNGVKAPDLVDLCGHELYIKKTPECPSDGVYDTAFLGDAPLCSIGETNVPYPPHIYSGGGFVTEN